MAVTLPGFRMYLPNSTRTIVTQQPTGEKILLLGPALDGPTNVPVPITNITDLQTYFGPLLFNSQYMPPDGDAHKIGQYSFNSLVRSVQEYVAGGGQNLYLVRVGGQLATNASGTVLGGVTAQSRFAGYHYNGSQISVVSTALNGVTITVISQPTSKGPANQVFTYPPTMTYGQVCNLFNTNLMNNTFQLVCPETAASGTSVTSPVALATLTLSGGTYGTMAAGDDLFGVSKAAYRNALVNPNGTFAYLDNVIADQIYVADLFADDDVSGTSTYSFVVDLATWCYEHSRDLYPIQGYIGMRPLPNYTAPTINAYVNRLTTVNTNYDDALSLQVNVAQFIQNGIPYSDPLNPSGEPLDIGRNVSIFAGPDLWFPSVQLNSYPSCGAPFYAGFIAQLPAQQAATNQVVPNLVTPAYFFRDSQRDILNAGIGWIQGNTLATGGGAYVTLTQRLPTQNVVTVTSDVTAAQRISNYADLQDIRICNLVSATVQGVCALFIGRGNTPATITAIQANLQTALDLLGNNGVVNGTKGQGYDFNILSSVKDQELDRIGIDLWIVPAREIKRINLFITPNSPTTANS